jgi:hypothetical protein
MTKFEVKSEIFITDLSDPEHEHSVELSEVTRTDRKAADSDASLIHQISGRRTWVVEHRSEDTSSKVSPTASHGIVL